MDKIVLGLDLNVATSSSPVKRGKSKMNNGKKEGQPAGKGVKGGFAVKRGVVAEISPKKSQGRALNRPSVMGPASTHHEK